MTTANRVAFWSALHERLAKLSNRIDGEAHGKILGAVHALIPMVSGSSKGRQESRRSQRTADLLANGETPSGGLGKPMTREDYERILKDAGWTAADIR
jgi:hypothetical protein